MALNMGAVLYLLVLATSFTISTSFIFEHAHAGCQTSLLDAFPGCVDFFNDTSSLQRTLTSLQTTLNSLKKDVELLSVRLVNGTTYSGDVELFVNGYWGAICDENWDQLDADVVCRMIGYNRSRSVRTGHVTNAPFLTSSVACAGTEDSIFECSRLQSYLNFGCDYNRAAGVDCEMGIRLTGSTSNDRGRVEVQHKGEWGTICDPNWTAQDAEVTCRMLGMRGGRPVPRATFGSGTGRVILSNILCYGAENHLMECRHTPFRVHTCDHSNDVGVVCDK